MVASNNTTRELMPKITVITPDNGTSVDVVREQSGLDFKYTFIWYRGAEEIDRAMLRTDLPFTYEDVRAQLIQIRDDLRVRNIPLYQYLNWDEWVKVHNEP